MLIMNGAGRAGEIPDLVDFDKQRKGHIVSKEFEAGVADQMSDVSLLPGEQIVHAQDIVTGLQQAIAKMGSQKSGAAGDQGPVFKQGADRGHGRRSL
jgi:hypothetical protein